MPLGDVWGNSWANSWDSTWGQAGQSRAVPTEPLRGKRRREDEDGWHPPQESEAERVERITRQRIRLGIVEAPRAKPEAPAPAKRPALKARRGTAIDGMVPLPGPAPKRPTDAELTAKEFEELKRLAQLDLHRRNEVALAALLLCIAE